MEQQAETSRDIDLNVSPLHILGDLSPLSSRGQRHWPWTHCQQMTSLIPKMVVSADGFPVYCRETNWSSASTKLLRSAKTQSCIAVRNGRLCFSDVKVLVLVLVLRPNFMVLVLTLVLLVFVLKQDQDH